MYICKIYNHETPQHMSRTLAHRHTTALLAMIALAIMCVGCSLTKHVPEGQYLLDKVELEVEGEKIKPEKLKLYVQQNPNYRIFGFIPLQLGIYNMSGQDSTSGFNKWARKTGEAPVIYSEKATEASCIQLSKGMANMGYMHNEVYADTTRRNNRVTVTYHITPNEPFYIDTIMYDIPHAIIDSIIHSQPSTLKEGMLLDRALLNQERNRLTEQIRSNGYYTTTKELITFNADTISSSRGVELTVMLHPMPAPVKGDTASYDYFSTYYINEVYVIPASSMGAFDASTIDVSQAQKHRHINIIYGDNKYLTPSAMADNCFIMPGTLYTPEAVSRTYSYYSRLSYLKSVNIRFAQAESVDGKNYINCFIILTPGKTQNISAEIEGTNSEGDLGIAAQLTYQHNNIFKGSEKFIIEARGAYESLSGTLKGIVNNHYTEVGGRVGIIFPKFLFPFSSYDWRRRMKASTEFDVSLNFQQRPEYTRIIAGAAWRYKWSRSNQQHNLNLLDINYVYLPKYMDGFLDQIAPSNPLLRYSYEDHFIMGMGYNYYTSNIQSNNPLRNNLLRNAYTLRASVESSGNLLYGISNLTNTEKKDGYKIFGIRYSQYVKGNIDYSYLHHFNDHHSLAFHAGFGIGIPYGNSSVMPFEKRFYSGGANSVRGWSVRSLGPGSYNGMNNINNFIYQCGDIRLDLSIEYRAKLFWKLESAIFIDAGNIWTIADYETQPGGVFKFNEFYKQIAVAYGIGLRLNFDFVIIRGDFGMKAYNPADNAVKWAIINPNFKRDFAWHVSIGYPF